MQINQLNQIVTPLLEWYHANKRKLPWREDISPYRVWISEIMLQQTRVEAVLPYYERFMEHYPSVAALAACDDEELMKLWEGLGYYSRAKNLKKAAQLICTQYHGEFPERFEDILALPGIGAYTAGAISSIAFEQAHAAVDGNVLRVITRLTENSQDITDAGFRRQITEELEKVCPVQGRGDFTQSLMELGAVVCVPNGMPKCKECPLNALCSAFRNGTQLQYPVKKPKAPRKIEEKTVLVLRYRDRIAVRKRKKKGVLSGMWELPNLDGFFTEELLPRQLAETKPEFTADKLHIVRKERFKHIFTHIEWHMEGFLIACDAEYHDDGLIWVTQEQLASGIALPTAFRKVYDKLLPSMTPWQD